MSEVVSIHLLELKHEWASQLNNCDEFRFPEAIAEANAGTKNRLAAKLQALTNVKNAGVKCRSLVCGIDVCVGTWVRDFALGILRVKFG